MLEFEELQPLVTNPMRTRPAAREEEKARCCSICVGRARQCLTRGVSVHDTAPPVSAPTSCIPPSRACHHHALANQ